MSHIVFHTKGIVIAHYPRGEADKVLVLYTRDFGMVHAHVRGIRKIESKLKYILQDYAIGHIDLVRGRDMWRLTSGEAISSLFPKEEMQQKIFFNVLRLVRRLCIGEAENPLLFDTLFDGLSLLSKTSNLQALKNLEFIMVFRILYHSGYLDGNDESVNDLLESPFSHTLITAITPMRQKLLSSVNKSMREIDT